MHGERPVSGRRGLAVAAVAAGLVMIAAAAPVAHAQKRTVAVAPLAALGAEDTSAAAKKLQAEIEKALAKVDGVAVVDSGAVLAAIKKAKRPELRVCEGDHGCLAELGKLVGAKLVVAGEAGGLGDISVVYLELIDAGAAKEVRSTTLEVGDTAEGGAVGAAYRLLAPDRYNGTLTLKIDAAGATVYVDGKQVGKAKGTDVGDVAPITLSVGTHALRVTHPEYRDFVRFVDVGFGADTPIDVPLQQFPIVSKELTGTGDGKPLDGVTYVDRPAPWYRKWWAIAGFAGAALLVTGVTAGIIADGTDADTVRPVTPP